MPEFPKSHFSLRISIAGVSVKLKTSQLPEFPFHVAAGSRSAPGWPQSISPLCGVVRRQWAMWVNAVELAPSNRSPVRAERVSLFV